MTSDTCAIANALGACIVDCPKLQSELVSLLTLVENQRDADRSTSREAVTLEAMLNLAHAGKAQIFVGEIESEASCILEARGERVRYSAEAIGHSLRKFALPTRKLGKKGKGLVMDLTTLKRVHELAAKFGGAGLEQDEQNLHCPFCAEKESVM